MNTTAITTQTPNNTPVTVANPMPKLSYGLRNRLSHCGKTIPVKKNGEADCRHAEKHVDAVNSSIVGRYSVAHLCEKHMGVICADGFVKRCESDPEMLWLASRMFHMLQYVKLNPTTAPIWKKLYLVHTTVTDLYDVTYKYQARYACERIGKEDK